MVEYKGVGCPVPNCQGFLKENDEGSVSCEYGHLIEEK